MNNMDVVLQHSERTPGKAGVGLSLPIGGAGDYAVLLVGSDWAIQFCNESAQTLLGVRSDELVGLYLLNYLHFPDKPDELWQELAEMQYQSEEATLVDKQGIRRPVTLLIERIKDLHGFEGALILLQDQQLMKLHHAGLLAHTHHIEHKLELQTKRLENSKLKLARLAKCDLLTGLSNRHHFMECLQEDLDKAHESLDEHVLLYLDLDQFKVVNDCCGHTAGDVLLKQLVRIIKKHIRHSDTLARMGADKFGLICHNCDLINAFKVANALLSAIDSFRFEWEGLSYAISASIGLSVISKFCHEKHDILSGVEAACAKAKEEGWDRIKVYDPSEKLTRLTKTQALGPTDIIKAIEDERLVIYQQTIASLKDDEPLGDHYEVLVRMYGENGELISPGDFLPIAEKYNFMPRVDRWIINKTCAILASYPEHLQNLVTCSINLSGQSLNNPQLIDYVLSRFEQYQIPAEKICFEITETVAINNLNNALNFINTLKKYGARFSLDDFGSGFSSFAYLRSMPVDYIKIDGMFVKNMVQSPTDKVMVRSINEIGHLMNLKTIAEFVENHEIATILTELGVDYAQGYGIAKPGLLVEHLNLLSLTE
jgi:diguanylate cyclase (GGDEF)-like protein/PAS domain S-box-containing protein